MAIFCWWVILNVMRPTMRGRNTPKYFGRDEIISHNILPPSPPPPPLLLQQMKRGLSGVESGIFIGDSSSPGPGTFLYNDGFVTLFQSR